jgi:hypothetical protein
VSEIQDNGKNHKPSCHFTSDSDSSSETHTPAQINDWSQRRLTEFIQDSKLNIGKFVGNVSECLESTEQPKEEEYTIHNYSMFKTICEKFMEEKEEEKRQCSSDSINYLTFDIEDMPDTFVGIPGFELPKEEETLHCGSIYLTSEAREAKKEEINKLSKKERKKLLMEVINLNHLSRKKRRNIEDLILMNEDICWIEGDKLGTCNVEEHEINLTDEKPVYVKQYPLPYALKEIAVEEAKKLIANDLVRPSTSAFNAPAFVVPKKGLTKDGKKKWRLVIDYRKLNAKTVADPYLVPNIIQLFDSIGDGKVFATIDMVAGFHQVKMKEAHIHKTAFSIPPLGRMSLRYYPLD